MLRRTSLTLTSVRSGQKCCIPVSGKLVRNWLSTSCQPYKGHPRTKKCCHKSLHIKKKTNTHTKKPFSYVKLIQSDLQAQFKHNYNMGNLTAGQKSTLPNQVIEKQQHQSTSQPINRPSFLDPSLGEKSEMNSSTNIIVTLRVSSVPKLPCQRFIEHRCRLHV